MLFAIKRSRTVAIGVITALAIMMGAAGAQAYTSVRYFTGFAYANQYLNSGLATTAGGDVNIGMPSSLGAINTEYIATFTSSGLWLASSAGGTDSWTYLNHGGYSNSYSSCWWNSNYSNPGQPQALCDQYRS